MSSHEISLLVDSSSANGALNVSSDGSSFQLSFPEPIVIPREAASCYLELHSATVWWTIPNISVTKNNNRFAFEYNGTIYDDVVGIGHAPAFTFEDGLYSLQALDLALARLLVNAGLPETLFTLSSDNPTQKVALTINEINAQVYFDFPNTIRTIIGFNSVKVPAAGLTTAVYSELGANTASFNDIEYFLIHSDLVSRGIQVNNTFSQTIGKILINDSPGTQILYEPYKPYWVNAGELIGRSINSARFWLTDNNNELVNTNGEIWSAHIIIRYSY